MAAFYRDALRLEPIAATRTDSWAEFASAGATLALHAIPPHIARQFELASPPEPREDTPIKLVFEVDDVEAEQARLSALGATMIRRPWGGCDGVDPEGNIFHIRAPE